MAAALGVALNTLKDFFKRQPEARDDYEDGKQEGFVSLRRSQFRLAEKNAAMGIWLGKQYLGQKDQAVHELTGKDGGPIETKDVSARDVIASRISSIAARGAANSNSEGSERRAG